MYSGQQSTPAAQHTAGWSRRPAGQHASQGRGGPSAAAAAAPMLPSALTGTRFSRPGAAATPAATGDLSRGAGLTGLGQKLGRKSVHFGGDGGSLEQQANVGGAGRHGPAELAQDQLMSTSGPSGQAAGSPQLQGLSQSRPSAKRKKPRTSFMEGF